jgi:hypothetical protein
MSLIWHLEGYSISTYQSEKYLQFFVANFETLPRENSAVSKCRRLLNNHTDRMWKVRWWPNILCYPETY